MQEWHEHLGNADEQWARTYIESLAAKGAIKASTPNDANKGVEGFLIKTLGAKLTDMNWVFGYEGIPSYVRTKEGRPGEYGTWTAVSVEAFSAHRKLMARGTLSPYDPSNVKPWITSIQQQRVRCWFLLALQQRQCKECLQPVFINFYVTDNTYECWMVPQLPTTMLVYKNGSFFGFEYCITEFVGGVTGVPTTTQPATVQSTWFEHAECKQVAASKLQMYSEPCADDKHVVAGGQMVKGDTFRYGGVMLKKAQYPAVPCGLATNPYDWVFVMRDADGVSGWIQAGNPSKSEAYVTCCAAPNKCTPQL
jgi:hypothetical protein